MRKNNKEKVFTQPSYTRFRTYEDLRKAFQRYPQQKPATPQAFDMGIVADFQDPFTGKIVTASEIKDFYYYTSFKVSLLDGTKIIVIENKGKFVIKLDNA